MSENNNSNHLLDFIVDRANVGIFVVNDKMEICLWNKFMEVHSGRTSKQMLGTNLFVEFPELPRKWLERKIKNVFILKNYSFSSWKQRPYLFKFPHNRPLTGGVDCMRQDCTLLPVKDNNAEVQYVCFTLFDVTDISIYQSMLQDAMAQVREASNKDGLTGLYNRHFIENSLASEFKRNQRYKSDLSIILTDIDHFKLVNDTHGHLAGDEVLRIVSKKLQQILRTPDILGRYGGEEFLVVLPETNLVGAQIVAERLRQAICEADIQYKSTQLPIKISLGITEMRADTKSYEIMIGEADQALYQSKDSGRNCSTVYRQSIAKVG